MSSESKSDPIAGDAPWVRVETVAIGTAVAEEIVFRAMDSIAKACSPEAVRSARESVRKASPPRFAFDRYRMSEDQRVITVPDDDPWDDLWFVGDLHGDLLALETAMCHIQLRSTSSDNPIVLFLGDLVDDGPHGAEVILRVLLRASERPESICLLAGNHDEALRCPDGAFSSDVEPGTFAERLRRPDVEQCIHDIGQLFVEMVPRLPRAIFLPAGYFAAHGGFPLSDLHASLEAPADLERFECLQDFVWTRAHPRAPRKIPNRSSRGCQYGSSDLDAFCTVASRLTGRPVHTLIRGHDHEEERFSAHPGYPNATSHLLTVNTLGHRLERESGVYPRPACVARLRRGQALEVHSLVLPETALRSFYPEPDQAS